MARFRGQPGLPPLSGTAGHSPAIDRHAWALFPNHFHLLLKTGLQPIATVRRRLLTGYAVSLHPPPPPLLIGWSSGPRGYWVWIRTGFDLLANRPARWWPMGHPASGLEGSGGRSRPQAEQIGRQAGRRKSSAPGESSVIEHEGIETRNFNTVPFLLSAAFLSRDK